MEILVLICCSCGAFSASTRPCAKAATSTPEPAFKAVMIFCALARLAACVDCAVAADVVAVLAVLAEVTAVVAIGYLP